MLRTLFNKSKSIHRYLGLALILYDIIMGISGIFVNHPTWIDHLSIPTPLVPKQYRPQNWDRNSLAGGVYDPANPNHLLTFGEAGVYESADAGLAFARLSAGFLRWPVTADTTPPKIIRTVSTIRGPPHPQIPEASLS